MSKSRVRKTRKEIQKTRASVIFEMLVRQGCKTAECVKRDSAKNTTNANPSLSIAPSFSRNESAQISEVMEEPKPFLDWDRNNYAPTKSSSTEKILNGNPQGYAMEISDDTEDESEDSGEEEPNFQSGQVLIGEDQFKIICEAAAQSWLIKHEEFLTNKILDNYQLAPINNRKRTLAQSKK